MRQRRGLILAMVGVLGLCGLTACGGDFAGDGKTAFEQGKYREAVEFLQVAVSEDPDDAQARFYLGVALNRMGRPNQARTTLSPLLDHPEYRRRVVRETVDLLINLEREEEAHDIAQRALESDPRDATLLEAAVLASAARAHRSRAVIDKLLVAHLGEGMERRCRTSIGLMVTSSAADFPKVFDTEYAKLQDRFGFSDQDGLRRLVEKNRATLSDLRSVLERSRAVDPTSFTSRLELARIAWESRDAEGALATCTEIIRIDPASIVEPERAVLLANAKRAATTLIRTVAEAGKRYDEGIKLLEEAAQHFRRGALDADLARLYYLADRREELAALSKAWIERDARDVWACFYRGWCLYRDGNYEQAIPYLVRAHGARPNTSAFNLVLGRAYLQRGDEGLAIAHLARAQELSPRDPHIVIDIANAYAAGGDDDRGRQALVTALRGPFRNRRSPESRIILAELIKMYQKVGQGIDDLDAARRLHQDDPDNPYIALRLAQLEYDEARSWDRAWTLIRGVHTQFPELADGWRVGAQIASKKQAWYQVHRQLDQLEALEPADPTIPWMRARALMAQKRYDDARRAASAALSKNPGERGIMIALVDIELAEKKWDQAIERATIALKTYRDDPDLQSRLAKAQAGKGNWKSAVATLRKLEASRPNDIDLLRTLGRGLSILGDPATGGKKLLKALSLVPEHEHRTRWEITGEMYRAKAYAACEKATAELIADLPRDSTLARYALAQLARSLHWQKKYLEVCDALVAMRRRGLAQEAYELFINLGARSTAFHEVASAFDVAATRGPIGESALRSALKAQIAIGDWKNALESVRRLGLLKPELKTAFHLETGLAQLGMKRTTQALASFRRALATRDVSRRGEVYGPLFVQLSAAGNHREIIRLLENALVEAPHDPTVLLMGGSAHLAVGEPDQAAPLLEKAVRRCQGDDLERARLLLCATHVARDSYAMAADSLEGVRSPRGREVTRLVAALISKERPPGEPGLAAFLWEVKQRRFEEAGTTATKITDMPRAWRPALASLAAHLAARETRAGNLARTILTAAVMVRVGVLEQLVEKSLKSARDTHPADAYWLDAFRAWARLEYGSPREAGAIVVPRIAAGSTDALFLELAAFATLGNTDAANVRRVIDGQLGPGAVPADLARDLAEALIANGDDQVADDLLKRISEPEPQDVALRVGIAFRLGKVFEGAELAAGLPNELLEKDPVLAFASAYGRLKKGDGDARKALVKMADRPGALRDVPFAIVAEVLIAIGRDAAVVNELEARLEKQPYDAYLIHRAYRAFARAGKDEFARRLAAAAAMVDPRGRFRNVPRHERPLAHR